MKVLRFTASWCQPCKTLAKILEQEALDIPALDIDTEEAKVPMAFYGIRSVPTIIIDRGNNDYTAITGGTLSKYHKEQIREALANS